jgi:hypothetical protein
LIFDGSCARMTCRRAKPEQPASAGAEMSLGLVVIIILILLLIGALPTWPHSRSWGYFPSGGAGLILIIVLILLLLGRI